MYHMQTCHYYTVMGPQDATGWVSESVSQLVSLSVNQLLNQLVGQLVSQSAA